MTGSDAQRRARRLGLAFAAACAASAAAAVAANAAISLTLDPVGGELAPTVSGLGERNETPDIAMNDDGDFVVGWRKQTDDGGEIWVRPYRADGTPRSGEVRVSAATDARFPLVSPSVAIDDTGDFVVAWNRDVLNVTGQSVGFLRRFTASATPSAPTYRLATSVNAVVGRDAVSMDGAGNYTVAFRRGTDGFGGCEGISVRRFRPSGTGTQADAQVGSDAEWNSCLFDPMLATASNGATVLLAQESVVGDGTAYWRVWRRTVASSGTPSLSNVQAVESFRSYGGDPPSVDIADDGSVVAVFTDDRVGESSFDPRFYAHDGVWVKRYDPNGLLTDAERANQGDDRLPYRPSAAISNSGTRWLATWSDDPGRDGMGTSVRARSFARGQRGPASQVNVTPDGDQRVPVVAMGPAGDAVITWDSTIRMQLAGDPSRRTYSATAVLLRRFSTQSGSGGAAVPDSALGVPIAAQRVEATSNDAALPLDLGCPAQQQARCTMQVTAATPAGALHATAAATAARATFRVRSGRVSAVRLALSWPARAALRAKGRIVLRLTVVSSAGTRTRTYRGSITLLARQTSVRATAAGLVTARVLGGGWVSEADARVTAFDGGRVAGTARLRAAPGVVRSVRLRLGAAQREKLRAGRSVRLRLVVAERSPWWEAARLADPKPRVLAARAVTVLPAR